MRKYVLTERERRIAVEYLETGQRLEGFRLLKSLILSLDTSRIEEDLSLIKKFLDKEAEGQ